ncbi:MAG: putative methyltransferase [Glaciecola sp.]|jgi:predicted methyltransferase|mmetsp:Transcript_65924/g.208629  ORF Transcript_65924/g.208629 Transcript_65924/m.208629 type:complete len:313 (-) Transcript_65924:358-1296(-)
MFNKSITAVACALALATTIGCSEAPKDNSPVTDAKKEVTGEPSPLKAAAPAVDRGKLFYAVQNRSDEDKVRNEARHPIQTLEFFKVAPGMSVAEALPGGGWYSKILAYYLGAEGQLHGINYNDDMWARFGFFSEEAIKSAIEGTAAFPGKVKEFAENPPASTGFTFADAPDSLAGTVDRVLFIRALHNLNRFEKEAGTMTEALKTTRMLLKDGGLVGVVQHQAPESSSDSWADGSAGYLKKSAVIEAFNNAGFELVSDADFNENPNDIPTEKDIVWRLPPTYSGTSEDPKLKAKVDTIGESNRMTLLFKKSL